jgi:tetratricopeptide (TPR) repeat protein
MAAPANEPRASSSTTRAPSTSSARSSTRPIDCFKRAAEADPKLYRAWAYLGMAYAQQGQLDPAIEAYRKCIDIAPDYHKAFNNVGELYRRKGLLDYAAMVFKMATEIEPKISHYFYNLGITYFEIGMYSQAEDAFSQGRRARRQRLRVRHRAGPGPVHPEELRGRAQHALALPRRPPEHAARRDRRPGPDAPPPPRAAQERLPPRTPAKSEVRRAPLEEEDENAKTKSSSLQPDRPTARQNDPPARSLGGSRGPAFALLTT